MYYVVSLSPRGMPQTGQPGVPPQPVPPQHPFAASIYMWITTTTTTATTSTTTSTTIIHTTTTTTSSSSFIVIIILFFVCISIIPSHAPLQPSKII